MIFQSTLPAWGATAAYFDFVRSLKISIHAPRMGSDFRETWIYKIFCYFNPRSPHGERPPGIMANCGALRFQSTLPAWGATE